MRMAGSACGSNRSRYASLLLQRGIVAVHDLLQRTVLLHRVESAVQPGDLVVLAPEIAGQAIGRLLEGEQVFDVGARLGGGRSRQVIAGRPDVDLAWLFLVRRQLGRVQGVVADLVEGRRDGAAISLVALASPSSTPTRT